jgi:F-type H+-transporting ATPase subunit alpha
MGITDGHIFFDSNAFYNGRRPAINIAISVTRVGKQTQTKLKKEINGMLSSFLAKYEKIQNFSHFGSELSPEIVQTLKKGEKLYEFFDQHYDMALPGSVQLIILALVWLGIFDHEESGTIDTYKLALIKAYRDEKTREVLKQLTQADTFDALLQKIRSKAADIINLCKINSESTKK